MFPRMHLFEMLKYKHKEMEAQKCQESFAQDRTGSNRLVRSGFKPKHQSEARVCVWVHGATLIPEETSQ